MSTATAGSNTGPNKPITSSLHVFQITKSSNRPQEYEKSPHHFLALQVAHNLRYQHGWTNLRLHAQSDNLAVRTPLISGLPPHRLYIHPDEQIELLQKQKATGNRGGTASDGLKLEPQREWVLPSHLREKWTLQRFGQVFDAIPTAPIESHGELLFDESGEQEFENRDSGGVGSSDGTDSMSDWRRKSPKRLLLATVGDDSTVVYYIVHDGIVKPRQN